jgi:hypothetical protein
MFRRIAVPSPSRSRVFLDCCLALKIETVRSFRSAATTRRHVSEGFDLRHHFPQQTHRFSDTIWCTASAVHLNITTSVSLGLCYNVYVLLFYYEHPQYITGVESANVSPFLRAFICATRPAKHAPVLIRWPERTDETPQKRTAFSDTTPCSLATRCSDCASFAAHGTAEVRLHALLISAWWGSG